MAIGDAQGLPIAIHTEAAAPAEVTLVEATLWQMETQVYQLGSRDRDPMQPRTVPRAY